MRSLFDNEYLGKPVMEQHLREIRQEIATRRLACEVQVTEQRLTIDPPGLWLRQLKALLVALAGKVVGLTERLKRGQNLPHEVPFRGKTGSRAPS